MKRLIFSGTLLISLLILSAMSPVRRAEVQWLSIEEALEKSKIEKRNWMVDVYTDWCGWCKVMDKKTFADPEVAKLLNEKFYAVKFNAEQSAEINFRGKKYKQMEGGTHELAAALLRNQLGYPTVVFIDADFASVSPVPGFKAAEEFHKMLMYFDSGLYKKGDEGRAEFERTYKSPYAVSISNSGN